MGNIDYFCGIYIGDKNLRKKYVEDDTNEDYGILGRWF